MKFTDESVDFLPMAISISSSLRHISLMFAKLLFPVVSKDFLLLVHVQNLNKETVEGSIVKAGHLNNSKPRSNRINCYNLVIDKSLRRVTRVDPIHVLSTDVAAYLVKTTIHHATLGESWKDLNSAKKKMSSFF